MPIEIKELVIRAVINQQSDQGESQVTRAKDHSEETVEECVRQVLRILERSKER